MIQASELRIGSTYKWRESILTLSQKDLRDILELEEIENIHPVPITTEILDRLGAINPYKDERDFYQIGLFEFNLSMYGLCLWDREGQSIMFGTIHMQYLHQLQNLYFALTGEELQITV